MGNKSSAAKKVVSKTSDIAKKQVENLKIDLENLQMAKREEESIQKLKIDMNSVSKAQDMSQEEKKPIDPNSAHAVISRMKVSQEQMEKSSIGIDPEMLKEISKWSIKKTPTASMAEAEKSNNSHLQVDGTETTSSIRHKEYQSHEKLILAGKSIPGRLTGNEINELLQKYSTTNKTTEDMTKLASEYKIDNQKLQHILKWTRFPIVDKVDN